MDISKVMDFSRSLLIGENTFEEIDDCEAKVKHAGLQMCYNHSIFCPNEVDLPNKNVENFTLHNPRRSSNFISKTETHRNLSAEANFNETPRKHSLSANGPILHKEHDMKLRTVSILQKWYDYQESFF